MTTDPQSRYLSFGDFRLDCRSGELRKGRREIRLQPQPAKLLVLLASRTGEIVTRTEIQKLLWGEDTFVDFEHGINFSIKQIRDALGDDAEKPRYIETVPRVGYRFVAGAEAFSPDGGDERSPYPGLSSFSSSDSRFFFGREGEVESVRRKLESHQMLALIGPSGSGKSSFLRAGLLPSLPAGFRAVLFTPGSAPMRALTRALAPEISGDSEAVQDLAEDAVAAATRWRKRCEGALVVIDAFEELFTLNPPEVQAAFASMVGCLASEAGVRVLLSMRDDFLFRCHDYEELAPVFSELTPLGPLKGPSLRRALEQPAVSCGYRFESEELVEEMLREVQGERGALPLLAFAASQLWERRDRERKLLTREAYERSGRVGGALAQHAEATLERIGPTRLAVVRELFRNLVTAQGTRASREVSELLSVFPKEEDRRVAEEVLRELVSARLLTAYETSVEIIHESLLSAWPRLVRWQTQDADGVQLRDQLRQAAQMWQERGRSEDLLWTGRSYREFELWRERYSGSLTTLEEDFAKSMTARATRTRRRRRLAVTAAIVAATAVAALSLTLWRRAETARRAAVEESRSREAAQLLSLGRLRLEDHPSAALAYALASLERADNEPARRFVVEALWQGPTEFIFGTEGAAGAVRFSGDGRFLAYGSHKSARLQGSEGQPSRAVAPGQARFSVDFSGDDRLVVQGEGGGPLHTFSMPEADEAGTLPLGDIFWRLRGDRILTFGPPDGHENRAVVSWPVSGDAPRTIGAWDSRGVTHFTVTADGSRIAAVSGGRLSLTSLDRLADGASKEVGGNESTVWVNRGRPEIATVGREGRAIRLWSVEGEEPKRERELVGLPSETIEDVFLDGRRRFVSARVESDRLVHRVWDRDAAPDAEPIALRDRDTEGWVMGRDFDPTGRWLAVVHDKYGSLWALQEKRPRVLRGLEAPYFTALNFSPDSRYLISGSYGGEVWRWALDPAGGSRARLFYDRDHWLGAFTPSFDLEGRFVVVSDMRGGRVLLIPLEGGAARAIDAPADFVGKAALSKDGRTLAVALTSFTVPNRILVRDLQAGVERTLTADVEGESCAPGRPEAGMVNDMLFLSDGRLLTLGLTGLRVFDLTAGTSVRLRQCRPVVNVSSDGAVLAVAPDGETVLVAHTTDDPSRTSALATFDIETKAERLVVSHGKHVTTATLDPRGRFIVTGSADGLVRVGPLNEDEEPHLLYGHSAHVTSVAVSPDGRWIASAAEDGTIRLWPMPEGQPLQTLPYPELLAKIRALTNLRVIEAPGSATGYKVEPGPFPGWARFPEW